MTEAMEEISEARPRRFRPYPEYKESGIDWQGRAPGHWGAIRVCDHTELINGYPFDSQLFTHTDGMPLVRIRDLESEETAVNYIGDPVDAARIQNGDLLIGMDGDFNVGRWRGGDALLNQRMCCLRPSSSIDGKFLLYSLPFPLKVINDLTYSTTVKHLSSFDVKKIRLPYPPLEEQQAIASFLDRETAKIDGLVAKKERLIELLQEKRTALITRAVTQGLDLNVPMKDSGVEWLGKIPAHWEVKRLRSTVLSCQNGVWGDEADGVHDIICVRVADFDRARFRVEIDEPTVRFIEPRIARARMLERGDLLLEKSGGGDKQPVGALVTYDHDEPAVCSNFVARVTVAESSDSRFLTYLHAALYAARINTRSIKQSTGIQNLDSSSYLNEPVALPHRDEQHSIAAFLDDETARIDGLVAKIQEAIDRLNEFRTALISAAVTGKIDVREEVA